MSECRSRTGVIQTYGGHCSLRDRWFRRKHRDVSEQEGKCWTPPRGKSKKGHQEGTLVYLFELTRRWTVYIYYELLTTDTHTKDSGYLGSRDTWRTGK